MSSPNMNIILQSIVALTNNQLQNAPQIANIDLQNPTYGATTVFFDPFFQATNAPVAVPVPSAPVYVLIVQNLSPSANLFVMYAPFGGTQVVFELGPGGVITFFDPAKIQGINELSLQGAGSTVPALVLVAV